MQGSLLKVIYFERGLSKSPKKATLFSLSNPVTFNDKVIKNTRGLEPFRLQNKFRKIPLLVMYYLTKFDDVI